jgi:L-amino acid N-acyltransferase YncA
MEKNAIVRKVAPQDAGSICKIYNHYIQNSIATFEEAPVDEDDMEKRIRLHSESLPWLVYEEGRHIAGYAYATDWRSRSAYRYSAESTVYVATSHHGQAIGTMLYKEMIQYLEVAGTHCIMAGISLPNPASIRLHEKLGFEKVAHFKEVGWKMNRWIDVGYWELLLTGSRS